MSVDHLAIITDKAEVRWNLQTLGQIFGDCLEYVIGALRAQQHLIFVSEKVIT